MTAPTTSRRAVLGMAAVVGAATATGSLVGAAPAQAASRRPRPRVPVQPRGRRAHVLRRAAWGPNPESLADFQAKGLTGWLDWQLNPSAVPDAGGAQVDALFPEMAWSITEARANLEEFSWDLMSLTAQYQIARAIWSRRQLHEVMVDFWHNFLHVAVPSDGLWDNAHDYDRTVIRKHALGKFSDMLMASAKHPSMLRYLNNADSSKYGLNENYGRELLELHTVSIESGYTEAMMLDAARLMTGWTINRDTGLATYSSKDHWTGPITILDFTSANTSADGRPAVDALLMHLARHEETAQHIARRMVRRFVADDPPPALVDHLASIYLANDTDVRPMVRALFTSSAFLTSAGKKVKRPLEDVVSTVRILGHQPLATGTLDERRGGIRALYWISGDLRQAPLDWSTPDGYPDEASDWQSADGALGRWNVHQSLAAGWWPNKNNLAIAAPQTLLPSPVPTTAGALVEALSLRLFDGPMRSDHRAAVLAFMGKTPDAVLKSTDQWLGWRLQELVALLLNSPAHSLR